MAAINDLPPEIWRDILLRLPITILTTTARLVNRDWFGIISSSEFVTARLKKSEQDKTLSDHRVLFDFTESGLLLEQFPIEFRDSSSINLVNFGYPESSSSQSVRLLGSCNGLLCVVSKERRILVLNPCTGKYNELPPLDLEHRRVANPYISAYGFGYDESNDDYKVVALWYSHHEGVGDKKIFCYIVKVYSLKSNSWRRIQDFKGGAFYSLDSGKLASGKVHWVTNYVNGIYYQRKIVSFDVGSEVFEIIEPPVDDYSYMRLDVLGGCICLLLHYDRSHVDLWVMKEYGVKEPWIKIVTVSYTNVPEKLSPWSLLPNGEILFFASYASFLVYNPNDGSFKSLDKPSWRLCYGKPLIYVQSLVSPICTQVRGRKKAKLG